MDEIDATLFNPSKAPARRQQPFAVKQSIAAIHSMPVRSQQQAEAVTRGIMAMKVINASKQWAKIVNNTLALPLKPLSSASLPFPRPSIPYIPDIPFIPSIQI